MARCEERSLISSGCKGADCDHDGCQKTFSKKGTCESKYKFLNRNYDSYVKCKIILYCQAYLLLCIRCMLGFVTVKIILRIELDIICTFNFLYSKVTLLMPGQSSRNSKRQCYS